ncbi:hypothetical protein AeMF1_014510 [Aphanomyces euteiches]|nr:hypothetical protein AeMF1_014510 [Aphanomyces euteiches]
MLSGSNRLPVAARVTNISSMGVSLLPRTILGAVAARGERPMNPKMIRINSNRYRDWEDEVYEGSFTRRFLSRQAASYEQSTIPRKDESPHIPDPEFLMTKEGVKPTTEIISEEIQREKERLTSAYFSVSPSDPPNSAEEDFENSEIPGISLESSELYSGAQPSNSNIFLLNAAPDIDQEGLDPELQIREGIDMTTEEMENQLAMIPEIIPDAEPVDIEKLDFGELDQPEEERDKMKRMLMTYKKFFIHSGNGLPPAARGAVCDIDVGNTRPITQRARRVRPEHLKQLFDLLKGLLDYGLITFSKSPWASPIGDQWITGITALSNAYPGYHVSKF